ncbi:MAG: hypothetical protein SCI25_05880 [Desulfuromonadales bacterium]|nr:hypothetical protein [Desulfuromonadales bacterium]MDW7756400.1 hypothetical protein [Desulfuromonadales bacterium]
MFGLGLLEIALLAGLIVLILGVGPARRLAESAYRTYRTVQQTKQDIRDSLRVDAILGKKDRKP